MGGTFMALDDSYKDYFIRNLHDALSGHTSSSVEEAVKLAKSYSTPIIDYRLVFFQILREK